jgi:predicted acyltransferase
MRLRVLVVLVTVCSAAVLAAFLLALWLVPRMTERVLWALAAGIETGWLGPLHTPHHPPGGRRGGMSESLRLLNWDSNSKYGTPNLKLPY